MKVTKCDIEGLLLFSPDVYGDSRGFFFESFNISRYKTLAHAIPDFVQSNVSKSRYGVVRGLHFQRPPFAQAKLVEVLKGRVLDVALDLRSDSPTFGRYQSVELSDENHLQFFIPEGFAHGFSVLSDEVIFEYKCSAYYNKESEGGILWCDPALNIDWGVAREDIIISDKDALHPTLREYKESLNR